MGSYYSILKFVNNSISNESIALGLIVIADKIVLHKISPYKIDFAKKLNPASGKLIDFSIKQLEAFLNYDLADQSNNIVKFPVKISNVFFERLSKYNNGLLQFTKPSFIDSEKLVTDFDIYYKKFIENNKSVISNEGSISADSFKKSELKIRLEKDFYSPLEGKLDLNYTLKKGQLPSLFFDFCLDGIGVNGSMYAVKSVDLNQNTKVGKLEKEISEFESVIERLNRFSEEKGINKSSNYYLISDPYKGKNKDYLKLSEFLQTSNMPMFTTISSNEIVNLSKLLIKKNVTKFTESFDF